MTSCRWDSPSIVTTRRTCLAGLLASEDEEPRRAPEPACRVGTDPQPAWRGTSEEKRHRFGEIGHTALHSNC